MRPSEIAKRLRGFSTPLGGLSWEANEPEVAVARRVITFLEDRRVLYNPSELEEPWHCVESVIQIRGFLTSEMGSLGDNELASQLGAMRTACRKFLNESGDQHDRGYSRHMHFRGGFQEWQFVTALGELRGVVGVLVAEIANKYKLDVEDDLASILPAEPDASSGDEDPDSWSWIDEP